MQFTLDAGKFLFDLLLELLRVRDKRRRDVFEQLLEPAYANFLEVHAAYNELFLATERSFPVPLDDDRCLIRPDEEYGIVGGERCQHQVAKTKEEFRRAREKNEWIRDGLRGQAQLLLKAAPYPEEKRFLMSMVLYFLEEKRIGVDDLIDGTIKLVEEKGGKAVLDSPSYRLLIELTKSTNLSEMRGLVETARHELNQRYSDVSGYFILAKMAVYRTTTD